MPANGFYVIVEGEYEVLKSVSYWDIKWTKIKEFRDKI